MLQPYDYVMMAVLVGSALWGRGRAWSGKSRRWASMVVSAAVAVHSSPRWPRTLPHHEPWNRFLAMLVLYVVTAGAIWFLFRLVAGIIDRVKLKEFDRQLGHLRAGQGRLCTASSSRSLP